MVWKSHNEHHKLERFNLILTAWSLNHLIANHTKPAILAKYGCLTHHNNRILHILSLEPDIAAGVAVPLFFKPCWLSNIWKGTETKPGVTFKDQLFSPLSFMMECHSARWISCKDIAHQEKTSKQMLLIEEATRSIL